LWLGAALLVCAVPAGAEISTNSTYDELFFAAVRYGNTEARRTEKKVARDEVFRRGPEALREVMNRVHLENIMLQVMAMELVREHVSAEQGTPVLLDFLEHERPETRRAAAYFLGFYPNPGNPTRLLKQLDHDKTRNAALRTLGKWRVGRARAEMVRLLKASDQERTRVLCANALRDIGNEDDLPALIEALGDPVFTVRNTAARAVASFGWAAHGPLLKALPEVNGSARRQVVRLLGELRVRDAVRPLRRLLETAESDLLADLARALRQIDADRAERWLRDLPVERVDSEPLFAR
jgi:HEAT repeat protein